MSMLFKVLNKLRLLSRTAEFDGKVIGSDPLTDIAIIKVDATDLPALPLGDSDRARVGEWMIAIGNPYGLSHGNGWRFECKRETNIFRDSGREYENFYKPMLPLTLVIAEDHY